MSGYINKIKLKSFYRVLFTISQITNFSTLHASYKTYEYTLKYIYYEKYSDTFETKTRSKHPYQIWKVLEYHKSKS